ncbi:MAG TPA: carboxypeptidase regulatory-like domain-containing protein [Pyrinomonadaceae bacterium]|jgi:YVTN family beta-propeller protein
MKYPSRSWRISTRLSVFIISITLALAWALSRSDLPGVEAQGAGASYKNFEAPQVHPLALTPDGTRLLAVNTPEGRLSVFQLSAGGMTLAAEIPVGLEPVSVAARNNNEAWVANWLSDSVSVVNLSTGNVTRTFEVGDEPTDIVFAGQTREMAFVCVSGLRQVKVFDPNAPDAAPQVLSIRGKQPRSLARDAAGGQIFVSVFESGNQTTIVPAAQVTAAGGAPPPSPALAAGLPAAPSTGLIVKWNGAAWADERGDTRWSNFTPYTLADVDVVAVDARGASAVVGREIRGVGTSIGNSVFDAAANRLYVANLEARNDVRFEPNLRGRFLNQRVSLINFQTDPPTVSASDLNAHINHAVPAGTDAERARSLSLPADIVRSSDGTLYVAATGSGKVGVLNANGAVRQGIAVGQGPTGLALDEPRARLYVLNRFEQTISTVSTATRSELSRLSLGVNPEPAPVREGRRFLYDGSLSAHGDLSCASCHLNGHRDGLAWDLGDPRGQMAFGPGEGAVTVPFHPMKGAMTTQSLRTILGAELLHWRGDRRTFADFNPTFMSLLGGQRQLTPAELAAFTEFVRTLVYPPNPNQNLDRTLPNPATGANAQRGSQLFNNGRTHRNSQASCRTCHSALESGGMNPLIPAATIEQPQGLKVAQLRGLYQKTGMTRAPGEQLSGFGFTHDGSFDTINAFLNERIFIFNNDNDRRDIEQFLLSFDTGTAPAVGAQVTVDASNKSSAAVNNRINLLIAQANAGNCDLVARGIFAGQTRGFFYQGGSFQPDRSGASVALQTLIDSVNAGAELTFTGVLPGAGRRLAIDRDGDGTLDGNEPTETLSIAGRVVGINNNPLGGVSISLSGTGATAQTDAAGRYAFNNLPGGTYTVTASSGAHTFAPSSQTFSGASGALTVNFIAPGYVQFGAAAYTANEATAAGQISPGATLTLTRTGDISQAASVEYRTIDDPAAVPCNASTGVAYARCDYATTVETVHFAPGEAQKTITIPLIDDAHQEGSETLTLELSEPSGALLGTQRAATLTINDTDAAAALNPLGGNAFFVRQHYLDFLSREPEPDGFNAWLGVLERCGNTNDPACDRLTVSSSFFRSTEFQLKGYFVYLFYKVSLNRLPTYAEIIPDMRSVTGATAAEVQAKRDAFANSWMERPEFNALHSNTSSDSVYVTGLLQRAQVTLGGAVTRETLIADLQAGRKTRAEVLRAIVEHPAVDAKEYNSAFVAMQYFGYLRRDPEPEGFRNWLTYLNANPSDFRTMVKGFAESTEYRLRFGMP